MPTVLRIRSLRFVIFVTSSFSDNDAFRSLHPGSIELSLVFRRVTYNWLRTLSSDIHINWLRTLSSDIHIQAIMLCDRCANQNDERRSDPVDTARRLCDLSN